MRPQDLNLLMVFDAIMTEKSITRAADRLAMTQPAVSNAVSRMRSAWKDEVFVKSGRSIQPTQYAQNLWAQIKAPLTHLAEAVDPQEFNPATAQRTFRVATTDILTELAWGPIRNILEKEAPGINLHAVPNTIVNSDRMLENAEVDLVIGLSHNNTQMYRTEFLFTPNYICVMRKGHSLAKQNLTIEEFANADHLLVSLSGDVSSPCDHILMEHGLNRRVAVSVNHFSAVAKVIENSNLISLVPIQAVADAVVEDRIAATIPPIEMPPKQVSMIWHKRQDRDAGLHWFRRLLRQVVTTQVTSYSNRAKMKLCSANPAMCSNYVEQCKAG